MSEEELSIFFIIALPMLTWIVPTSLPLFLLTFMCSRYFFFLFFFFTVIYIFPPLFLLLRFFHCQFSSS